MRLLVLAQIVTTVLATASKAVSFLPAASPSLWQKEQKSLATDAKSEERRLRMVTSQLDSLEKILVETHHQDTTDVNTQKAAYKEQLKDLNHKSAALEKANAHLDAEIRALDASNKGLEKHAKELRKQNERIRSFLRGLRQNLSIADEFAEESLMRSRSALNETAPEVEVLSKLTLQEYEQNKMLLKAARLQEVSKHATMAMLQHSSDEQNDLVKDLQDLSEKMNSLLNVKEAKLESLTANFEKSKQEVLTRQDGLRVKQEELKRTLDASTELNAKLKAAVDHLRATHAQLMRVKDGLLGAARRLS